MRCVDVQFLPFGRTVLDMQARVRGLLVVLLALSSILAYLVIDQGFYVASESTTEFFVSPTGSDSAPGTITQPFLTLDRARITARSVNGNVAVKVRQGAYELPSTLNLVAADSGRSGVVTYQSYPGEIAVLRGSKSISGFTPIGGGIYQADLASQGLGSLSVDQVYFNGTRLHAARYPNYVAPNFSAPDPWAGNYVYVAGDHATTKNSVKYANGALNAGNWSNPTTGYVNIFGDDNYLNEIKPIASVAVGSRQIVFGTPTVYDIAAGNRFFVAHLREELDVPGEWFFDASTKRLLVIPPAGEDIGVSRVSVPVIDEVFRFSSANNIAVEGFVIEETKKSGVILNTAQNVRIASNAVRNTGQSGIEAVGKVDAVTLTNNEIYDTGAHGIFVLPDKHYQKILQTQNFQITNNRIYRAGAIEKGSSGIRADRMFGGLVAHNELRELPRIGIFAMSNNLVIEENLIFDINRETEDTGGIYLLARSWIIRGNTIRNNFIRDTGGYGFVGGAWKYKYYSRGIYLDDYSSGNFVYNNIVARSTAGALMVHGGMDNRIYNNIAANDAERQTYNQCIESSNSYYATMWQELETLNANGYDRAKYFTTYPELNALTANLGVQDVCRNNQFYRNILYFPSAGTHAHLISAIVGVTGTKYGTNLIWPGAKTFVARSAANPGANYTWESWRALGYDTDSLLGDPLFRNPSNDDYLLLPGSPAEQIGFEPLVAAQTAGTTTPPPISGSKANALNKTAAKSPVGSQPPPAVNPATQSSQQLTATETGELTSVLPGLANQVKLLGLQQASVVVMSFSVILLLLCALGVMLAHRVKIAHAKKLAHAAKGISRRFR